MVELERGLEMGQMQEKDLGQLLEEGEGQELRVAELRVAEAGQRQLRLHSVTAPRQKRIYVGMKLHSPTCVRLPQTPLQLNKQNNIISILLDLGVDHKTVDGHKQRWGTWSLLGQNPVLTQCKLFLLNEHPVDHHHLCRGAQSLLGFKHRKKSVQYQFRAKKAREGAW